MGQSAHIGLSGGDARAMSRSTAWLAALTILMLGEKVLLHGPVFGRLAGAALVAWGAYLLISPA